MAPVRSVEVTPGCNVVVVAVAVTSVAITLAVL